MDLATGPKARPRSRQTNTRKDGKSRRAAKTRLQRADSTPRYTS